MLNETEIDQLRSRHEQSEQHVKDQLAKLESLGCQMSQSLLSDGNVKLGSAVIDQHDSETVLDSKQKTLDSMSQFVDSLYLAILDLSDKVQMIEEGYQFSQFLMAEDDHKNMDTNPKRLVESMRSLCEEIPSEFALLSKKGICNEKERQTHGHLNVRILNRAEQVSL
jgi:hypothetical protein